MIPWRALLRSTWSSGSRPCSWSRRVTGFSSPLAPTLGRCSGIHAAARARNASTLSTAVCSIVVMSRPLLHPDEHREALSVLADRTVQGGVLGHSPQVEMKVVVPGHADPAVELHALLDDGRTALRDIGLGHADQLAGFLTPALHRPRAGRGRGLA